jgi:flavin reductase (DIM6/NTAB) family NADH-FMN oxidoreductase RutF
MHSPLPGSPHVSLRTAPPQQRSALPQGLRSYEYAWPQGNLADNPHWRPADASGLAYERLMPEPVDDVANDSRWPAFFPSPISIVTARSGERVHIEKVVGASIVNRFPYIVALSFCRTSLSHRHYERREFMDVLESGGTVAVQFLPPGQALDSVMNAIAHVPDDDGAGRFRRAGLATRPGKTNDSPIFDAAYMAYEAALVKPGKDFGGEPIFEQPWTDVGSHRVYYLEIKAIQLRQDIAEGRSQICWRSVPSWTPERPVQTPAGFERYRTGGGGYEKGYSADYRFPSLNTIGFAHDAVENGFAIKLLAPLAEDQVEVDNDRARWPCFFPSSLGMITTWDEEGVPNLMPCGSTTIISRQPMVISPCVSYARINDRYAPRQSLDVIRRTGRFGCGVPFLDQTVISAIKYAGNVSLASNKHKVIASGLEIEPRAWSPVLTALPVHFDCEVVGEVRLGTHIMFLGEVRRIELRSDVTADNPLRWCPWADVVPVAAAEAPRLRG